MIKSQLLYIEHFVDRMRYDAIPRNLQTMSEATQRLSQETKNRYQHISWRDIAGFRNILVHDYLGDKRSYSPLSQKSYH
jgi:uncharacterized protein with HEPN domain